jgi:hypothetical protein
MDPPFSAYSGDEDYVFVCYAHADSEIVYPELSSLNDLGVRLWYDEGISAGRVWRSELAERISGASCLLAYISLASLASGHCQRELHYALDNGKKIVPVYLDDVSLTPDLELGLALVQALKRYERRPNYLESLNAALGAANRPSEPVSEIRATPGARRTGLMLLSVVLVLCKIPRTIAWNEAQF